MEQKPALSLIVSFYKNVTFLKNVLFSIENQSFKDFEVIISDDGSPSETVEKVKELLAGHSFKFQYVWHEDRGFRKTTILNKSVVSSKSDYLVFIDGDCVLHPHFLKEHFKGRIRKYVRSGRRVLLTEKVTKALSGEKILSKHFGRKILLDMFLDSTGAGFKALEQGVYFRNPLFRLFLSNKDKGILGCNFSMFKEDLLSLNGFDERFVKAGVGEDSDLQARIRRAKTIRISSINKRAIVYHQFHKLLPREPDIYDIYYKNRDEGITYTPYGIYKNEVSEN